MQSLRIYVILYISRYGNHIVVKERKRAKLSKQRARIKSEVHRMNIAAYCRVSTDKADQLNSLEAQKQFFTEYTKRTGDTLVRLYADEGLSGTKIKNRKEFQQMMADADTGLFDMVVVKDISRFARNTVDLLQNIRRL